MSDDHPDALRPGHLIGQYRVVRELGRGGFGITYLAQDPRLDRRVAIKEYFPPDWAARAKNGGVVPRNDKRREFEEGLKRFWREARVLAQVDHPNIVRVHCFEEQHGTGYIVMEFVEGQSLSKRLERQKNLSEADIRRCVLPIKDALAAVHGRGHLHLDVAPKNIMLTPRRCVLLDFGAAQPVERAATGEATILMTPDYAALEQHRGEPLSVATDIYGLGAVLYRCVTGHAPWRPERRADNDRMPRASGARQRQAYSPELLRMIDAALAVRAEDRPNNIEDWQAALTGSVGVVSQSASCPPAERSGRNAVANAVPEPRPLPGSDRVLAEQGDADAQYRLGLLAHYEGGLHAAAMWYDRAAQQNHAKAQFALGMMCFRQEIDGLGVDESIELAVGWCMDAAHKGLDRATAFFERDIQAGLEAYRRGDDYQAELEFRRLAQFDNAEKGDAQFRLAQMYIRKRQSDSCADDQSCFDQGCEWLRRAARSGSGRAEAWLYALLGGHHRYWLDDEKRYRYWLDVEQNDLEDWGVEGWDWYGKAAERSPEEQYELGLRSEGDPDHAWHEEASFWYRLAAQQGHIEAQFRLGLLTICGLDGWHSEDSRWAQSGQQLQLSARPSWPGVFPEPTEERPNGEDWLRLAAHKGHPAAGGMFQDLLQTILDDEEGIDYFFLLATMDRDTPPNVQFSDFAAEMLSASQECAREPRLLAGLYRTYRQAAQERGVSWTANFSTDAEVEAWYAGRSKTEK